MSIIDRKIALLSLVASLMGCEKTEEEQAEEEKQYVASAPEEKHCVSDENGTFVDDKNCEEPPKPQGDWQPNVVQQPNVAPHASTFIYFPHYHYVYVPTGYYTGVGGAAHTFMESRALGTGRSAAVTMLSSPSARSAFISRGGFGHVSGGTTHGIATRGGFGGSGRGFFGG